VRVALVSGHYDPLRDGVSDYTRRLAVELGAAQVETVVITTSGRAAEASDALGVARAWTAVGVARTARLLRRLGPDVVHVQFAPSAYGFRGEVGLLPLLLGRSGPPLVVTLHEYGWWSWRPRWLPGPLAEAAWSRLERRGWWDRETQLLVPSSAAVVVSNQAHASAVTARLPGCRARVTRIPIGINLEVGTAAADRAGVRAELQAPADAPLLVHFGFAHPNKGVEDLIQAVGRLRRSHPDLRLLIVGGTHSLALRGQEALAYRRRIEQAVRACGLEQAVRFTGYQPAARVSRLLDAADVAVLPFTHGTTAKSSSLLTVLAHGLPVVATAADPPDPLLEDGRTVLLAPRRHPAGLAAAIQRLLDDPALRARLAREGGTLAARHAWPAIAAAHRQLYRQVARGQARSSPARPASRGTP
jgi:glycosyltransferase involved in cell wall biosynthesis